MLPTFTQTNLLSTALTHRSALNEHNLPESNERLEFLGDAVLELISTQYLFRRFPEANEGILTSYRAALVRTTTLASIAQSLGLDQKLLMSKGEERGGGRENQGLLADTFEAVLGALYLDQGFAACEEFLQQTLFPTFDTILAEEAYKDFKTSLQEEVQAKGQSTPVYTTIGEEGPDHQKTFTVDVRVDGTVLGVGTGKSKQEASQMAAKAALEAVGSI